MELNRLPNETPFEHKLRLVKAKHNREIDLDWSEIVELLGLDIHPDELRKRSYGMLEYDEYLHADTGSAERILCISDAHVPFNLPIDIFAQYAGRVDTIVFNGDILDCMSCSSYPKQFRLGLDEELIAGRQYILDVVDMIKPSKIVITVGNHECRLGRYLTDRLNPDVLSVIPTNPLDQIIDMGFVVRDSRYKTQTKYAPLREVLNIEIVYDGNYYQKVGNVLFVHPLKYSSGMLKTTEDAVNYFLRLDRTFTALVMGHTHKVGSFVQGGIKMYEQGCVCNLNQFTYNNGKLVIPSQNGFMYICLDNNGNIIDSKTKIITEI